VTEWVERRRLVSRKAPKSVRVTHLHLPTVLTSFYRSLEVSWLWSDTKYVEKAPSAARRTDGLLGWQYLVYSIWNSIGHVKGHVKTFKLQVLGLRQTGPLQ
jgi:hypothetical protein